MKLNFGQLAQENPVQINDNVSVSEADLNGTKVSLVSTTMNTSVTFKNSGIVFPFQAMGTLTTEDGSMQVAPGEIVHVQSGDVFTPQLGFATLVLLNNGVD